MGQLGRYTTRRELPSPFVHDFDAYAGDERVRLSSLRCLQEPSPAHLAAFAEALVAPTRLGSAAIPPVVATGYDAAQKRLWAARAWCGNSLEDKPKPIAPEDAQELATMLRATLEALHSKGFVHGRLLPSRVARSDAGTWSLLDAGLVAFLLGARGLVVPGLAPMKPPKVADDVRGFAEVLRLATSIPLEKQEFPDPASVFAFFAKHGFGRPPAPAPPPPLEDLPNPFADEPLAPFPDTLLPHVRPEVEALAAALGAVPGFVDGMFVIASKYGDIVLGNHGLRSPGLALAAWWPLTSDPARAVPIFAALAGDSGAFDLDDRGLHVSSEIGVREGRNLVLFEQHHTGWQTTYRYGSWSTVVGAVDTAKLPTGRARRHLLAAIAGRLEPPPRSPPPALPAIHECRFCRNSVTADFYFFGHQACHACARRHLGIAPIH